MLQNHNTIDREIRICMLMTHRIVDVKHGTCTRVDKPSTRLKCKKINKNNKTSKIIGAALAAPAAPVPTPLSTVAVILCSVGFRLSF